MNGSSWFCFAQLSSFLVLALATSTSAGAEIQPTDCARAAKYSESKRGVSMLVIQNGRTVFEHYANGGSSRGRWPIFSGTKSFWGIAAIAAMRDGLFKLDDPVSDTITERCWTRLGFYLWAEPSANLFRAAAPKTKRARRNQLLRRTCIEPAWTRPAQLQKRRSRQSAARNRI